MVASWWIYGSKGDTPMSYAISRPLTYTHLVDVGIGTWLFCELNVSGSFQDIDDVTIQAHTYGCVR